MIDLVKIIIIISFLSLFSCSEKYYYNKAKIIWGNRFDNQTSENSTFNTYFRTEKLTDICYSPISFVMGKDFMGFNTLKEAYLSPFDLFYQNDELKFKIIEDSIPTPVKPAVGVNLDYCLLENLDSNQMIKIISPLVKSTTYKYLYGFQQMLYSHSGGFLVNELLYIKNGKTMTFDKPRMQDISSGEFSVEQPK